MSVVIGPKEAVDVARDHGALATGHFLLSSGLHSEVFFNRKPLERDPEVYKTFGRLLVDGLPAHLKEPDAFDSLVPVPSGGNELAKVTSSQLLGERRIHKTGKLEVDGEKTFDIHSYPQPDERVAIVEDVVTTGGSVEQIGNQLTDMGAMVVAVFELANRKLDPSAIGREEHYLIRLQDADNYNPDDCPGCERGEELVKL